MLNLPLSGALFRLNIVTSYGLLTFEMGGKAVGHVGDELVGRRPRYLTFRHLAFPEKKNIFSNFSR
jgi:hypothetical protein